MTDPAQDGDDLDRIVVSLDELTGRIDGLDPQAQEVVDDYLDALNALHRSALTALVRRLAADPRGAQLLDEAAAEPGLRMVLMMHGLLGSEPAAASGGGGEGPAPDAVLAVLDRLRPDVRAQGADLELVALDGGVARLRLTGPDGRAPSGDLSAVRRAVESVLVQLVPGLTGVRVEVPAEPSVIPAEDLLQRTRSAPGARMVADGWLPSLALRSLPPGTSRMVAVPAGDGRAEVLLVNLTGSVTAFVGTCPRTGGDALDVAAVDVDAGTLGCPCHGTVYDLATGEPGEGGSGTALTRVPVRVEADRLWLGPW